MSSLYIQQLLTVAAVSFLAQLAVQLAARISSLGTRLVLVFGLRQARDSWLPCQLQ